MAKKKTKTPISPIITRATTLFLNKSFVEGRYFNVVLRSLLLLADTSEYTVWYTAVTFNNVTVEEVASLAITFVTGPVK